MNEWVGGWEGGFGGWVCRSVSQSVIIFYTEAGVSPSV